MDSLTLLFTASFLFIGLYFFICIFRRAERAERVSENGDILNKMMFDMWEWGWGQSLHFSPSIPGKSHREAIRLHEERVADLLNVKPGARILDAGCGVGGPMLAIATYSGANIVGITLEEYQVKSARTHNKEAGLESQCEVVCGSFLEMPFSDNSFDGAYSIEATCHAPNLEQVYTEIFRVMKPGSMFLSYEVVTTELYNSGDPEHVEIIHDIQRGSGLPELRSYKDISIVAKRVGFEVLNEKDLAKPPGNLWWTTLKIKKLTYWRHCADFSIRSWIGILPKGSVDVYKTMVMKADYLAKGGEKGLFNPMYMILCRKPKEH